MFALCTIGLAFGADFSKVDKHAESVPGNLKTTKEIARYLTRNLNNTTDKTRAIYYWIARNIRYDVDKMNSNTFYTDPQELVDYALATREGVCSHYSALFQALCQSAGVQSYVIDGYIRQNGKLILAGHSWNAVVIGNQFYDIDVTWAAGYVAKNTFIQKFRDDFFLVNPSDFIKTHIPFDPIWQFSSNPITFKQFDSNNFKKQENFARFNFFDSIKMIPTLSPVERLKREKLRIINSGISNKLLVERISDLSANIDNEELKIATNSFNQAVGMFNDGVFVYNKYITSGSKILNPKTAQKFLVVLNLSRQKTVLAADIASSINTKDKKLNKQIATFKKDIQKRLAIIDQETGIAKEYAKK
jgi:hypothetical protein